MDFEIVLQKIIVLAQAQFRAGDREIEESTTASDIAAWNSLSHVMLMASIERTFDIKFDLLQMIEMKSIGDIARATHEMLK
jgi:acyl carrier protein